MLREPRDRPPVTFSFRLAYFCTSALDCERQPSRSTKRGNSPKYTPVNGMNFIMHLYGQHGAGWMGQAIDLRFSLAAQPPLELTLQR